MQVLTFNELNQVSGGTTAASAGGAAFVGRGVAGAAAALVEGFVEGAELGSFGGPLGAAVGAGLGAVAGVVWYKYSSDAK